MHRCRANIENQKNQGSDLVRERAREPAMFQTGPCRYRCCLTISLSLVCLLLLLLLLLLPLPPPPLLLLPLLLPPATAACCRRLLLPPAAAAC